MKLGTNIMPLQVSLYMLFLQGICTKCIKLTHNGQGVSINVFWLKNW